MNLDLTISGDIKRLRLEPKDVVLVTLHGHLGHDEVHRAIESIRQFFAEAGFANKVLCVSDNIELTVTSPE